MSGLWVPSYIAAERLEQQEDLPSFHVLRERCQNLPVEYYVKWGVFPKYCFLKTEVYEHPAAQEVRLLLKKLKMEVRHHKTIPWWVCTMDAHPHSALDVARFYARRTAREAVEQGYATEV